MTDAKHNDPGPTIVPLRWWLVDECGIAAVIAQHATLRRLCEELEDCADLLPDRAALARAMHICTGFSEALGRHEAVEQSVFSSLIEPGAKGLLPGRIRHCHAIDHLQAEDLHDSLTKAVQMVGPIEADTLGYMMRCLFEGCRLGIDLQEAGVLLLAADRLTRPARLALQTSLTGIA